MPALSNRQEPLDPEVYSRAPVRAPVPPADPEWQPRFNANMRCPVPPTNFNTDSSQQFYRGNTLPQFRTFSPNTLTGTSGAGVSGGGSGTTTIVQQGSSTTTTVTLTPKTASVTTAVISFGQNFQGILQTSRMFAIQSVTASGAARIRVYATAAAQTADLSRTSAQSPAYGTTQGLIAGVSLTTVPYIWLFTPPAVGTNGDSPTTPQSYITVGQLGSMSGSITVTVTFLPLQS
jgi:hypothetical protein